MGSSGFDDYPNMTQNNEQLMMNVRTELGSFPSPVQANYDRAREALTGRLADDKLDDWAQLGLTISKRTVRSWEAGAELFNASPKVQRHLPAGQFISWVRIGDQLCTASPSLAVAFFRASPEAIERLRPRYIGDWAQSCRSLVPRYVEVIGSSVQAFRSDSAVIGIAVVRRVATFRRVLGRGLASLLRHGRRRAR